MTKQPAMTSVYPANKGRNEQIQFIRQQIKELQQQKKCYDKMIKERKNMIVKLRLRKIRAVD